LEAGSERAIFENRRSTPIERNDAVKRILDANIALIGASRLTYYGPTELMVKESEVGTAALSVLTVFSNAEGDRGAWDGDALDRALVTLTEKSEALRSSCARSVGHYRDGPENTRSAN
jgi:hypothetical protein